MAERFSSVQEATAYMEKAYDRGGRYMVDGRPRYTAHAVRMEDETGLKGIAGRYKFVDGKEAAFAEYDYRKRFLKYSIASSFMASQDPVTRQAGETLKSERNQHRNRQTDEAESGIEEFEPQSEQPDRKLSHFDRHHVAIQR